MGRVTHFDISALDANRAIDFYSSIFSWKFDSWDMDGEKYWLVTTGADKTPGINGGMVMREKDNYVVMTISVKKIDQVISRIREKGGRIVSDKSPIPGVGYYAQFEDPEGNLLSIMEDDETAK